MSKNTGKIVQVIGPVVDVAFENGDLPQLLTAIEIPLKDSESLVVEVAQHIGDETCPLYRHGWYRRSGSWNGSH